MSEASRVFKLPDSLRNYKTPPPRVGDELIAGIAKVGAATAKGENEVPDEVMNLSAKHAELAGSAVVKFTEQEKLLVERIEFERSDFDTKIEDIARTYVENRSELERQLAETRKTLAAYKVTHEVLSAETVVPTFDVPTVTIPKVAAE